MYAEEKAVIITITRMSWSSDSAGGRKSCRMMTATNSSVISGTPRITSMKPTAAMRIAGSRERRPSASRMPTGSDKAMPASPATRLSMKPPNLSVGTVSRPNPPTSRIAAITGYASEYQRP